MDNTDNLREVKVDEVEITVTSTLVEDGRSVVNIIYPKDRLLTVKNSAHLLASGISVLIKSCSHNDLGIKDYELIEEVIEHLNKEFTSTKSFEDVEVNDIIKKL